MGYIFDALNRLKSDDQSNKPSGKGSQEPEIDRSDDLLILENTGVAGSVDGDEPRTASATQGDVDTQPAPGPFRISDHSDVIDSETLDVDDRLVAFSEPTGMMSEEYRSIRTGILARWQQKRRLVHMITSATPQEGKTITALNLGFSFAELRNRRTAVLEADLRLPLFEKMISLPRSPGLVGLLEGRANLAQAVHRLANDRLHVIPAGRRVDSMRAVQLLAGSNMSSLIKSLRDHYDHVIIDTPPVVELADAGILGAACDETLVIARMNHTPRSLIEQAIRTLASYNARVGGLIATDQNRPRRRFYDKYGYKYSYSYHSYSQNTKKAA